LGAILVHGTALALNFIAGGKAGQRSCIAIGHFGIFAIAVLQTFNAAVESIADANFTIAVLDTIDALGGLDITDFTCGAIAICTATAHTLI
jgi:hypothetical protein